MGLNSGLVGISGTRGFIPDSSDSRDSRDSRNSRDSRDSRDSRGRGAAGIALPALPKNLSSENSHRDFGKKEPRAEAARDSRDLNFSRDFREKRDWVFCGFFFPRFSWFSRCFPWKKFPNAPAGVGVEGGNFGMGDVEEEMGMRGGKWEMGMGKIQWKKSNGK